VAAGARVDEGADPVRPTEPNGVDRTDRAAEGDGRPLLRIIQEFEKFGTDRRLVYADAIEVDR
jgi:hypothetical protein